MKGNEKVVISDDSIRIYYDNSKPPSWVMHNGEKFLMNRLAEIATKNGGDILEIGFGMHLSADGVQSNPNVTSHTIIEVHPEIYKTALEWSKDKSNTNIILGDWIEILPTINKKFDGVLHDTHLDPNISKFLDYVKPNCKKGTIVAFFEYYGNRSLVSGVRVDLNDEHFDTLPYRQNNHFSTNSYELKYTIFDGNTFQKDRTSKNIRGLI